MVMRKILYLCCFVLAWPALAQESFPQPYAERADVAAYISELAEQHGFAESELKALFARAQQRQDIIERISRPAEKTWSWARYRKLLVDEARIEKGVAFWADHVETLAQAQQVFGVEPEYVLAILGIETRYGEVKGSFHVLDALATLGFDYPPRADFFRSELTQFLLLAREEGKDPAELLGSYAGAMGYGQFISSSYRHYAVDFDEDGVRDIWSNPVDAIGSIANYFAQHKWRAGELVARKLNVSAAEAQPWLTTGLSLPHAVAQLAASGLPVSELPGDADVALYRMDAQEGDEYWLGLHNFYVITRYNRSHMYALAVHQLSQEIKRRYTLLEMQ
ncbi:MAG: lytic murein transglycosylase B [Pseudomonadales bacterium]|jgi:membrane-bound lytic murein transglycosylase B|nr:lytic murein transglycosylase B [Pseudomonadales bacterium]